MDLTVVAQLGGKRLGSTSGTIKPTSGTIKPNHSAGSSCRRGLLCKADYDGVIPGATSSSSNNGIFADSTGVTPATLEPSSTVVSTSTSPVTPVAVPLRSYRVSFWDALKFNGPAPEIVNSRLAMIGFVLGARGEALTGETLRQQAMHLSVPSVVLILLTIYASLVPILKGSRSEAFGMFSPRAEVVNGRAAMLAVGTLLLLEHKSGVPFF